MLDQVKTELARTNLAPIPMECDAPHLKVTGELPRDLNGTLYRNGPNPQFEAPGAHWFVGDGMLHAFHLENGRASYRNRWVRTPKWLAEHDAGRALFGGFGRKLPGTPAGITDDGGVANTNIIFHGGKLLALEEGHLPTEIEPDTLNRLGYCDYNGAIKGPFTAHPKIDPVTGEMVFFGYNAAGPLDDLTGEFPRIDDRRAGQANSHGWYACANPDLPMFGALSGIVHVDGKGKRLGHYLLPAGDTISEPVFVERAADASEGDGWLLSAVWRAQENRSDLAVFNAQNVEAGPVALVHLGHRVPDGFHGNWVGAE